MFSYSPEENAKEAISRMMILNVMPEAMRLLAKQASIQQKANEIAPTKKEAKKILPPRKSVSISQKSFERRVNELISMGFPPEQCRKALKAAFNNVTRAAEYLLSGNIPSSSFSTHEEIKAQTQKLAEENHSDNQAIPVMMSGEDIASVKSISPLGHDISTVIQTYIACDKNREVTQFCLSTM